MRSKKEMDDDLRDGLTEELNLYLKVGVRFVVWDKTTGDFTREITGFTVNGDCIQCNLGEP